MKKLVLFLLVIVLFSNFTSAALGISPAIVEINFVPGAEHTLKFNIISDDPLQEIEVFLDGDFSEYSSLSKTELVGGDFVIVQIKLPYTANKPGFHSLTIGAKTVPSETSFLGTAIDIRVPMKIFVPYPGRYVEGQLNLPDSNVGEEIPVELHVINRGKENLFVKPDIDFLSEEGDIISSLTFKQVQINTTGERYFRKFLNTSEFKPGNYLAKAIIDYGEIIEINRTFRIGSLFVDIVNFTKELPEGGIQRYYIDIESKWNNNLGEVFADVVIFNDLENFPFRTPSVELKAWNKETLEGFLDTRDLDGEYDVNITLHYRDQTNFVTGKLLINPKSFNVLILTSLSVILLLIVIFILLRRKKGILINKNKEKDEKN